MSVRERQQMNLDTESAAQSRMEHNSRSSHKYLILQVWCGVLTVAMVVMAAFVASIMPKSAEDEVSSMRPSVSPAAFTVQAPQKLTGSSPSFIQLTAKDNAWSIEESCGACSLVLEGTDTISCKADGTFFIYAQVTFFKQPSARPSKSVILLKNPSYGRGRRLLVEGTFPTTESTVFVAKIVKLKRGDKLSINITDKFRNGHMETFWGAYQLQ